jgi:purine-binding chemotaxis protein CheW
MSPEPIPESQGVVEASPEGRQFLTFTLANEEYGIDVLRVQEIKAWEHVTPLPHTPEYVPGVINLRETIAPVVDLRLRFGLAPVPYGRTTVVVVVRVESEGKSRIAGMIVDAVSDVHQIAEGQLSPPPNLGAMMIAEIVSGLATIDNRMIILLDIDRLLTVPDITEAMECVD